MVDRYEKCLAMLEHKIGKSKKGTIKILDVGGYDCDLYDHLVKHGYKDKIIYHLVDFDRKIFPIVKKKGIRPTFANINYTPVHSVLKGKKYDIIICTEVFEHIIDPIMQLKSFKKVLDFKGQVLISMPNECTIFHRIYMIMGLGIDQLIFTVGKHIHFPTIRQAHVLVSDHLKIIDKKYYINMGGRNSRFSFIGKLFDLIPQKFWMFLAERLPSLFARGTIFLCEMK